MRLWAVDGRGGGRSGNRRTSSFKKSFVAICKWKGYPQFFTQISSNYYYHISTTKKYRESQDGNMLISGIDVLDDSHRRFPRTWNQLRFAQEEGTSSPSFGWLDLPLRDWWPGLARRNLDRMLDLGGHRWVHVFIYWSARLLPINRCSSVRLTAPGAPALEPWYIVYASFECNKESLDALRWQECVSGSNLTAVSWRSFHC